MNKLKGYEIDERENGEWYFTRLNLPVAKYHKIINCGHCGKPNTLEGHDGCIGNISHVDNACCGHGTTSDAYVVFSSGTRLGGEEAEYFFELVTFVHSDIRGLILTTA